MARNRFNDAAEIQDGGACNISGIAQSLKDAAIQARQDGCASKDLAVRLIVAQLAYLCNCDGLGGLRDLDYGDAMRMCREKAGE